MIKIKFANVADYALLSSEAYKELLVLKQIILDCFTWTGLIVFCLLNQMNTHCNY
jgi:hypothetical protein